ncbi:hypothetical protein Tco_1398641 [Tanacetum coccineum]
MYKLVKKLKILKTPLNSLSWSKGSVFDKVKALKDKLKTSQENIDKNPHDESLKKVAIGILNEYTKAVKDELSTLSMEEAMDMVREVNDNEIKEALFDKDGDKAFGPDGSSSDFFKKA